MEKLSRPKIRPVSPVPGRQSSTSIPQVHYSADNKFFYATGRDSSLSMVTNNESWKLVYQRWTELMNMAEAIEKLDPQDPLRIRFQEAGSPERIKFEIKREILTRLGVLENIVNLSDIKKKLLFNDTDPDSTIVFTIREAIDEVVASLGVRIRKGDE